MCSDKSSTNQRADHDVVSPRGPTIFIADPHRGDRKRFVVRADEKLSAFVKLERQVLTMTFYLESIQADSCR